MQVMALSFTSWSMSAAFSFAKVDSYIGLMNGTKLKVEFAFVSVVKRMQEFNTKYTTRICTQMSVTALTQRSDNFRDLCQHEQRLGRDLIEGVRHGIDHRRQQYVNVFMEHLWAVILEHSVQEGQRIDLHV
jgi:hypothetical protein